MKLRRVLKFFSGTRLTENLKIKPGISLMFSINFIGLVSTFPFSNGLLVMRDEDILGGCEPLVTVCLVGLFIRFYSHKLQKALLEKTLNAKN